MSIGRLEKARLDILQESWSERVLDELRGQFSVRGPIRLQEADKIRLLTWKVWSERYAVELGFIVKTLVGYWRQRTKSGVSKRQQVFGIGIPALTGRHAEETLLRSVAAEYPDGGNVELWKQTEQQRQLCQLGANELLTPAEERRLWHDDPWKAVKVYSARMMKGRTKFQKVVEQERQRRYRGNPWL